jgi:hypothetical protein
MFNSHNLHGAAAATFACLIAGKSLALQGRRLPVHSTKFCVTLCAAAPVPHSFILPALAFNLYYQWSPDRRAAAFIKTG